MMPRMYPELPDKPATNKQIEDLRASLNPLKYPGYHQLDWPGGIAITERYRILLRRIERDTKTIERLRKALRERKTSKRN